MCMGSNLGPTMAAFMMDKIENKMPNTPQFYCRYVDDIFTILKSPKEAENFLTAINQIHPNIQFTKEEENDKKIVFLDVEVNHQEQLITKWHLKETNNEQYLHKHAYAPQSYKYAAIRSLIYRAFRLCSNRLDFENCYKTIQNIFINRGYHYKVIDKIRTKVIGKLLSPQTSHNEENIKYLYFCIPYLEKLDKITKRMMGNINSIIGPNVKGRVAYNTKKSQSFFSNKDKIPTALRSNLVYQFSCGNDCDRIYIGETSRHLATRVKEHLSGRPTPSEVSLHQHVATPEKFKILLLSKHPLIAESLCYHAVSPHQRLNNYHPPFELKLFNYSDIN